MKKTEEQKVPRSVFSFDFDLFGRNVDIYYKGRPQRSSWLGRILTIFYAGIYIFFFIYRLKRMVNKSDVTFYDTYAFNGKPPFMQMNHELFYSGFALIHPLDRLPFIAPNIYNIKIFHYSGVKKGFNFEFKKTELPIEVCNLTKFGSNYRELFSKKNLTNLYCIKNINQTLEGHQTYDIYSYYLIQFFPCVNSTQNKNMCAPSSIISALLNKYGVTLAMQDIDLTPQNYKNPIQYRVKEVSFTASSNMYMDIHSYWKVVNIETDEDILGLGTSNNIRRGKYIKYDQAQILYSSNTLNLSNPDSPLISFTVGLSEQELTETRTYPKLIAVIGDVGGFMEFIFSFFSTLTLIFTENLYRRSLVNHLFSFDLDKQLVLIKSSEKEIQPPPVNEKEKNQRVQDIKIIKNKTNMENPRHNKRSSKKTKSKITLTKRTSISSSIFDIKVKGYNIPYNNGNSQIIDSSRQLNKNNENISEKDLKIYNKIKETEKEQKPKENSNIIETLEINQFKPKFCYKKKREHIENILFDEALNIILTKLDIQNLFKKIYKDEHHIEEKSENEFIEMSNICKSELKKYM